MNLTNLIFLSLILIFIIIIFLIYRSYNFKLSENFVNFANTTLNPPQTNEMNEMEIPFNNMKNPFWVGNTHKPNDFQNPAPNIGDIPFIKTPLLYDGIWQKENNYKDGWMLSNWYLSNERNIVNPERDIYAEKGFIKRLISEKMPKEDLDKNSCRYGNKVDDGFCDKPNIRYCTEPTSFDICGIIQP
jgi:hypothetical protein